MENEDFLVTYGDCQSDLDVFQLLEEHRKSGKICTLAAARPSGRNVILPISPEGELTRGSVMEGADAWTGASIYAFSPKIFRYLQGSYELDYFVRES